MAKLLRFDLTGKKHILLIILILPLSLVFNIIVVALLLLNPRSWRFNKAEASELLEEEIRQFREMPYQECLQYVEEDSALNKWVSANSGEEYQIDVQLKWDGCKDGPIRVIGSIDDGRLRAYAPLSISFIIQPNGNEEISEGAV